MTDLFNLNNINESLLENIRDLTKISTICEDFVFKPTHENSKKIIEIIQKSEKNLLKVKKNIVTMLNVLDEENNVINVEVSKKGFILE